MKISKRFIGSLLLVLCVSATGFSASQKVDQGVFIELTRDGFQLLSKFVHEYFLADMDNESLDDIPFEGPLGVKGTVGDVFFSAKFRDLRIEPANERFIVNLNLLDVVVQAGTLHIEQGQNTIDCTDTTIKIAEGLAVPMSVTTKAGLVGDQITFESDTVDFNIPWSQYAVAGPKQCSSGLGGLLKRFIIRAVLSAAKPIIERRVSDQVADAVPGLAPLLNQLTHQSLPIEIKDMPPLPNQKLFANLKPFHLTLTPQKLRFEVSVTIGTEGSLEFSQDLDKKNKLAKLLGTVGININILNELVEKILPVDEEYTEVTAEALDTVLNRNRLSAILPDLNEAPLESNRVRLFIRLTTPLHFSLKNETQALRFDVKHLQAKFMVKLNGAWQDYFVMDISLSAGANAILKDAKLVVGIDREYSYAVEGHWADGYAPQIDRFETDVVDIVLETAFDALAASYPLATIQVPVIKLYGQSVSLDHLQMEDPFIKIDALSVEY